MRQTPLVLDFELSPSMALAWYQSYSVSRDERFGSWRLYERRDYGADSQHPRVITSSQFASLDDLAEAVVFRVVRSGIGGVWLADTIDARLEPVRNRLQEELRARDIYVDDE